ncbi:hypothetical protein NGRA_2087 [Nosema granulosis]|uniref:Uncharacterized protein n=1 Tax=Nosema granulosis TaxID=83296 RepID=A0A9P6H0J5_9MICR|nr:hypothetical protein NGRA_2087 [Nosema granulosis]
MDKYFLISFLEEIKITEDFAKNTEDFLNIPIDTSNVVNEVCSRIIPMYLGGTCCRIVKHSDNFFTLYTNVKHFYSEYSFNEKIMNVREAQVKKLFENIFQTILRKSNPDTKVSLKIEDSNYAIDIKRD